MNLPENREIRSGFTVGKTLLSQPLPIFTPYDKQEDRLVMSRS